MILYILYAHVCMAVILCAVCALPRFSQLNPLYFSLAYSGVLVRRNSQQQPSTEYGIVSERDSSRSVVRFHGAARTDKDEGEENGTLENWKKKRTVLRSSLVPVISFSC